MHWALLFPHCLGCLSSWTHLLGRLLFQVKSPRKLSLRPLNQPKPHILSAVFLDFSFDCVLLKILLISPLSIKCTLSIKGILQRPSLLDPHIFFPFHTLCLPTYSSIWFPITQMLYDLFCILPSLMGRTDIPFLLRFNSDIISFDILIHFSL